VIRFNPLSNSILVGLFGLMTVHASHAQGTAAGGAPKTDTNGYKIGVVDIQQVLKESAKRKKGYDELNAEKEAREVPLNKRKEALQAMAEDFKAGQATMTDEERFERNNKIDIESANLVRDHEQAQREIYNLEEKILNDVFKEIKTTIEKLGKDQNYHVILSAKTDPKRGYPYFSVLYHHSSIDLTSEVIKILNAASE